jgi:glycosyltransferase involved in cell wall biosynthesis
VLVLDALPKDEYDAMIAACDVGLIFLDYRFTIPNYPSRLLAYMQAGLPVLACTDPNTDVGKTVTDGGFGWWCPSNDPEQFVHCVHEACAEELAPMQVNAAACLRSRFRVDVAADMIDAFLNT